MKKLKTVALLFTVALGFASCNAQNTEQTDGKWRNLFDGESLNGWKSVMGEALFEVKDGVIIGTAVYNTPNTFLVTEETFDDYIMEVDIMINHISSNSGVMVRGQFDQAAMNGNGMVYGYQIESDPTERAWSGGLYDEARRGWLYPLDLNPKAKSAFKMGEWNTYRIEAIGNEIKSWINGQEVAYVVDDMDSKGFIGLQVHAIYDEAHVGEKTYFRNVRVQTEDLEPTPFKGDVFVVNTGFNELTELEKQNGWKLLFDGETSEGWIGAYKETFPEEGWHIKDGVLTIEGADGSESTNYGDIVTKEMYSAFDLAFDFKISEGANSGVKYFVTLSEGNKGSAIGLEYQILDDERHPDAKNGRDGNRTLASLYDLKTAQKQARFVRKPGQWNQGRIVVNPDNSVEHYINGVKVLDYVRGSEEFRELVANSKYKIWENFGEAQEGRILLQDHGDEVSFKNIKIKTLK